MYNRTDIEHNPSERRKDSHLKIGCVVAKGCHYKHSTTASEGVIK